MEFTKYHEERLRRLEKAETLLKDANNVIRWLTKNSPTGKRGVTGLYPPRADIVEVIDLFLKGEGR